MADTTVDGDAEVLRSERDQLRAEVERLQRRSSRGGWWRRAAVAVLLVIASVSYAAAVPGIWARRNFLDTDRFVQRVGPLVDDPAVQDAVTFRLTEQLMVVVDPRALFEEVLPERGQLLAVPLAGAVEGFVHDRVESFVASDRFEQLWVGAATVAHRTAVRVLKGDSEIVESTGGQVTLNLLPVIDAVLQQITSQSPEILGRQVDIPDVSVEDIPETAIVRLEDALGIDLGDDFGQFTVYDDGTLEVAQDAVDLFDRIVIVLLPLAVLAAAAALWVTRRRRRTLLQLAAGVAVGMVVIRRVVFALEDDIAALPPTEQGRRAAVVAVDTFLDPLTTFALWSLAGAALVALVATLTGPYAWAVRLRHWVARLATLVVSSTGERARDEATLTWIAQHRDALLLAGAGVGLLVLWVADLSWVGVLVVLALVAAVEAVVYRVASLHDPGRLHPA
jgi:hypothetical protein